MLIVDKNQMKNIENESDYTTDELMEKVGIFVYKKLQDIMQIDDEILILCGNGNNGGDGFVLARQCKDYHVKVCLVDGKPKTEAAQHAYVKLPQSKFVPVRKIKDAIANSTIIIDCVYGFGFHGKLKPEIKKIFQEVNSSKAYVISIDINSGAECDTGHFDKNAIHSNVTYALDCYKPFHLLQKDHHLFQKVECISLDLPHPPISTYPIVNEDIFFDTFPRKKDDAYKGTYGKMLLIGGSYGMAGAVSLNITGAKTIGASYINVALPDECYSIVASQHVTPVYHPFSHDTYYDTIMDLIPQNKAIGFGSGANLMSRRNEILDLLLQNSTVPIILDAQALRLLHQNTWILRFRKCPVIITPHIGEFADILNKPIETILDAKISYARKFAQDYKVYVVLKGPHTLVASPSGEVYINQSGTQALAQAGSGDVLTGMIVAMLTFTNDVYQAVCNAVWLHGYLSEYGLHDHSMQNFPIEKYPEIMDKIFQSRGY